MVIRVIRYRGQEIYTLQDWQEGKELKPRGTLSRDCLEGLRREIRQIPQGSRILQDREVLHYTVATIFPARVA